MSNYLIDAAIIAVLILGISLFRAPARARIGNLLGAIALLGAVLVVLWRNPIIGSDIPLVGMVAFVAAIVAWLVSRRVNMIQVPAMVAFQNGAGGGASFLVSFVELTRNADSLPVSAEVAGIAGLMIGAATLSGSLIASGKLANLLKQTPVILPRHNAVMMLCLGSAIFMGFLSGPQVGFVLAVCLIVILVLSLLLGVVFSIRVGGADMPVLISFLNATTGLAAAFCGVAIQNRLLIACGATVAASGSILTHFMCRAMNRNLWGVFEGIQINDDKMAPASVESVATIMVSQADSTQCTEHQDPLQQAIEAIKSAETVIIIPGYGMALAEAQFDVVQLSEKLTAMGKQVRFAIHPVAGRMPGHMHVLLAEAEVEYDKLCELDEINRQFPSTDVVLIVGACDVVNPAAIEVVNTPISGMPILLAHEAKCIIVCNLDEKPGYSGVENPLYHNPKTIMLLGDATDSVSKFLNRLD